MMKGQLISTIADITQSILQEEGLLWPDQLKIAVQHPASVEHGEYSSSIAMQLAKLLKRSPLQIAAEYKERLLVHPLAGGFIQKIEVAPPGFINLYLDWQQWAANAQRLTPAAGVIQQKVLIEHTSINPNKSAHIGHLRNSCIGDTLARMLRKSGYQVEVHNYIDDLGNQLADTVVGMLQTSTEQAHARFGDFCWETYAKINKAYKEEPELLQHRDAVLSELEKGQSNTSWIGLLIAERIVREHVEEMKVFGISYDVLVWESSIMREGFWQQAFELLQTTPIFRQEIEGKLAGCWVLKQPEAVSVSGSESESAIESMEQADFQSDKVLIRSNGILTYTAKDIAYHLWKFGLLNNDFRYKKFTDRLWSTDAGGVKKKIGHADMVINVIDQRQQYPQAMVKQALLALGFEQQASQLRHVSYGVVSLSRNTAEGLGVDTTDGKNVYPMSGRQGIGIKINDFLNRMEGVIDVKRSRKRGLSSRVIAAASIRYYLLRFHLQTEVVFDLEQATEVSGNTGVYLLYSYARSHSILDKAKYSPMSIDAAAITELDTAELSLMRQLAYWPDILRSAVEELAPNHLCTYAHELSSLFNHFYAVCPILKAEPLKKIFRLWLTNRYKETLHEALDLLGLPTPKRM